MSNTLNIIRNNSDKLVSDWLAKAKTSFNGWMINKKDFMNFMPEPIWCPIPDDSSKHEFEIIFLNINPGQGNDELSGRGKKYVKSWEKNGEKYSLLLQKDLLLVDPVFDKINTNGYFIKYRFNWYADLLGKHQKEESSQIKFWKEYKSKVFIAELCPFHTKGAAEIEGYLLNKKNLMVAWENLNLIAQLSSDLEGVFRKKVIARGAMVLKLIAELGSNGSFNLPIYETSIFIRRPGSLNNKILQILALPPEIKWSNDVSNSTESTSKRKEIKFEDFRLLFVFHGDTNNLLPNLDCNVLLLNEILPLRDLLKMSVKELYKKFNWREVTPSHTSLETSLTNNPTPQKRKR